MVEETRVPHGSEPTGTVSVEALIDAARDAERSGDSAAALQHYEKALAGLDDPRDRRVSDILRWIGSVHRERGETRRAERRYRESLEATRSSGYTEGQAHAVNWLAVIAMGRGNLEEAESTFKRARRLAIAAEEERLVGAIEQNLGILANIRGDFDTALVHYRSAIAQFQSSSDPMVGLVLNNLGMLHTDLEQWDEADDAFARAMEVARDTGNPMLENAVEVNLAELHVGRAEWDRAAEAADRALELARARNDRLREAEGLKFRGIVHRNRDRLRAAEHDLEEAATLAAEGEDRLLQAEVARELGELFLRLGRTDDARAAFARALDLFRGLGATLDCRQVESRLADVAA